MKPQLKQFGDLTPADFAQHPVWIHCHVVDCDEPWYDDTDEETFRPWTGPLPVNPDTMYLVSATIRLADGSEMRGFVTPKPNDGEPFPRALGLMQPQVFTPSGKLVGFWLGRVSSRESIQAAYRDLGRVQGGVFPIHFKAMPGLTSGICEGQVPGFCSIPQGHDAPVKVEQ